MICMVSIALSGEPADSRTMIMPVHHDPELLSLLQVVTEG